MGGFGTWDMACKYPDLFAAIAPVCGGGDLGKVDRIKHLPVWVFHGARDSLVPVQKADDMVHALQDVGGNVRYTRYEEVGHDAWNRAYPNADLYAWFLAQKLLIP
jgi:predicted peptidase